MDTNPKPNITAKLSHHFSRKFVRINAVGSVTVRIILLKSEMITKLNSEVTWLFLVQFYVTSVGNDYTEIGN